MKAFYSCKIIALFAIAIFFNLLAQAQSKYSNKVLEFLPAPGQYTNKNYPKYNVGDTQDSLNKKTLKNLQTSGGLVSLGAYGGFIILGFDHSIANSRGNYDFKIYGNAFAGNGEPGIVMVSKDENKNGIADDPWYELKGSAYDFCTPNYELTYIKPAEGATSVPWRDNIGRSGTISGQFPLWRTEDSITFRGTLFEDSLRNKANQWGYADNVSNTSEYAQFKILWAMDTAGNPIHLSSIDFVKIYTAMNKVLPVVGEVSTEVAYPGIEDLHPNMHTYADNTNLDPSKEYITLNLSGLLANSDDVWNETLQYDEKLDRDDNGMNEKTVTSIPFVFHYATSWWGDSWEGVTYTNKTNTVDKSLVTNQFSAITGGGVDGKDSTYLTAYFSEMTMQMLNNGFNDNHYLSFSNNENYRIAGTYITNTTAAYYSMLQGDAFAKKFGGDNGTDKDWLKVTFTGVDDKGDTTRTLDFYLADFRSDNSADHYILNNWHWLDLSSFGKVEKVYYTMSSSDKSIYNYMNTPAYFCLDKVTVEQQNNNTDLVWIKTNDSLLNSFSNEKLDYKITIPFGSTQVPVITTQATDKYANAKIITGSTLSDTTFIIVTAENGSSKKISITFSVAEASSNAYLSWIKVNDTLLNSFLKETFNYQIAVPFGSTEVPIITFQADDELTTIEITTASSFLDTVFIVVTAQNGNSKTYKISFKEEFITGIENINNIAFAIYPNPVENVLYLKGDVQFNSVILYNAKGQQVKTFFHNLNALDFSTIPSGIYLLQIECNNGEVINKKIVKK